MTIGDEMSSSGPFSQDYPLAPLRFIAFVLFTVLAIFPLALLETIFGFVFVKDASTLPFCTRLFDKMFDFLYPEEMPR